MRKLRQLQMSVSVGRCKQAVLFFLIFYMTVLIISVTWMYRDDVDVNAVHAAGDSGIKFVGQQRLPTAILLPGPKVHGQVPVDESECPGIINATRTTRFYRLNDHNFFLSAYFDARKHDHVYIRLISVQRKSFSSPIYCLVNGIDGQIHSVLAQRYPFNENHARPEAGFILSCPMKDIVDNNPCGVRISTQPDLSGDTLTLPVLTIPAEHEYRSEFGVCIPPLHGHVSEETLVDFVETTRQLGANHFYFYRYDGDIHQPFASAAIQRVTKYYADKGLATVYPWYLPVSSQHIWYNGQVLAIHHCLYQNIWNHKYLSFNDIDEFLVPQTHDNWTALMSHLDDDQHSGFQFKSAFFPPDIDKYPLVLNNIQRSSVNAVRTKCIVRPERMFEMGIHHISKWNEEHWPPMQVDAELALLNHYRRCDPFFAQRGFHCSPRVDDKIIFRYKAAIEKQFNFAMKELKQSLIQHDKDKESLIQHDEARQKE